MRGWILGRSFDMIFIAGVALLALAAGLFVQRLPTLFYPVLLADLWLLGYHHVIATFTRLTFDSESFREHRFLVVGLPWFVLAATVGLMWAAGAWAIATIYFYWQWFHYTRQSYGIAKVYLRKAEFTPFESRITIWSLYLVPVFGILYRSQQPGSDFLGLRIKKLPHLLYEYCSIPIAYSFSWTSYAAVVAAAAAAIVSAIWIGLLANRIQRQQTIPAPLLLYVCSHFAVFFTGYYLIEDIDHGWLVLNIWHNAQYILFVWWFNTNRFGSSQPERSTFLSRISQKSLKSVISYFAVTLCLSTVIYFTIERIMNLQRFVAIPASILVTFQAINFHHYIVDGIIWKRKRTSEI